jgi:LuxR family maltose regulon positive regulatory protein/serine/threonine-protein kinase PknK
MSIGQQRSVPRATSARFQAPTHLRSLIERRRLLAMLRAGQDRQLTLIHAPAGYGKTTLAVQWCRVREAEGCSVAWLGLHRDDNSPSWFLSHLLEAVRRALPAAEAVIGELTTVLEQNPDDAERYTLSALIDQIGVHDGGLLLAFDDWHLVEDARVTGALVRLLDFAPPNLSVMVTSRTRPALPLSRLRVRQQLTEIDADLLRFDAEETRAFLVDLNGLRLGAADVERLSAGTDGWVAALQLASLSLRDCADPGELIRRFSGRHHSIGEYLAENVLDALPADILDFLLTTSVCDRLCGDLAAAVSGNPAGQVMLEELERRDLFLRPLDEEREWFRYHHLFADYLRRRLERDHPGRIVALHAAASAWFAEQGLVSEAVAHALAAGDVTGAVDLVERYAMPLVEHSRMVSLLGLVSRLPADAVDARPRLLMAVAWANCLLQRALPAQLALDQLRFALPPDGRGEGGDADDRGGSDPEHTGMQTEMLSEADVVQAAIDVYGDRIDRAEGLVRPSLDRHLTYRPWVVAVAANIQSFVDIHTFRFEAGRARQNWARPFHDRTTGPFAGVYGRCFAGIAAFAQLDLAAAEQHLQDAVTLARDSAGRHSHAAQLAGALLGELHYERGELDDAERLLEESRELGAESGVVDFMLASYVTLARIKTLRGDQAAASELLAEGLQVADRLGLPRLRAEVLAERVRVMLDTGRTREACRAAQALPDGSGCHGGIAVAIERTRTVTLARVLSAKGDHAAAIGLLEELVEETAAAPHPRAELMARVELAAADQRGSRAQAARRALAPVLHRAALAGLHRSVLDGGPEIVEVLGELDEEARAGHRPDGADPVPADYLASLLAGAAAASRAAGPPADPALRSLSGREVEILQMLDRGLSNREIALNLAVTVNTVKWYLKNIYAKLGVSSRMASVSAVRRGGLLG